MEPKIELKQNNIEKKLMLFSDIEFGEDGIPQKFVCMTSDDGKEQFMASYPPSSDLRFHMDILMHFLKKFKEKFKIIHKGGGSLVKSGNIITAYGTSSVLKDFDKDLTRNVLKEYFPDKEIIIE